MEGVSIRLRIWSSKKWERKNGNRREERQNDKKGVTRTWSKEYIPFKTMLVGFLSTGVETLHPIRAESWGSKPILNHQLFIRRE